MPIYCLSCCVLSSLHTVDTQVPFIPSKHLYPRDTWQTKGAEHQTQCLLLLNSFRNSFSHRSCCQPWPRLFAYKWITIFMRGLSCYRMYMLEVNLKCHLESKKIKYSLCVKWRNHLYFRYTNMQTPLPCIKCFIKSKFLMIKHVDKYFDTLKKPYVPSTCSLCFWG